MFIDLPVLEITNIYCSVCYLLKNHSGAKNAIPRRFLPNKNAESMFDDEHIFSHNCFEIEKIFLGKISKYFSNFLNNFEKARSS